MSDGIKIPFNIGNNGYFEQPTTSSERIIVNMTNWFRTRPGTRPLNPRYGSRLHNVLFDNNEDDTRNITVRTIIEEEISVYFSNVTLINVDVREESTNIDTYILRVILRFSINNEEPVELEIPYNDDGSVYNINRQFNSI